MAFATSPVLTGTTIDTHGPRISSIVFSSNAEDSGILGCLESNMAPGGCQAVEWTLTPGSWQSIECPTTQSSHPGPDCFRGEALGYEVDGYAFNEVTPYMTNANFRMAIQMLMNYPEIGKDVCEGQCDPTPDILPCKQYAPACYNPKFPLAWSATSEAAAANLLIMSGLVLEFATPGVGAGVEWVCINPGTPTDTDPGCTTGVNAEGVNVVGYTPSQWNTAYPNAPLGWLTAEPTGFGLSTPDLPTFIGFITPAMMAACVPVHTAGCKLLGWYTHTMVELGTDSTPGTYEPLTQTLANYTGYLGCSTSVATWAAPAIAGGTVTVGYKGTGTCPHFTPYVYYREDDPLRWYMTTDVLQPDATMIGLDLTHQSSGISGDEADTLIYGYSEYATIIPGEYDPSISFSCIEPVSAGLFNPAFKLETSTCYGANDAPMLNSTYVNGTTSPDTWGIYTFGWILSPSYEAQGELWNSQFMPSPNFGITYNQQLDHDADSIFYADHTAPLRNDNCQNIPGDEAISNTCSAVEAAVIFGYDYMKYLPYVTGFYEVDSWAVATSGWSGFANVMDYGPSTGIGISYTNLNVCYQPDFTGPSPSCNELHYVLHEGASSMNPLYYSPWVWQEDLWGDYYEGALGTAPACSTVANVFIQWMIANPAKTTGCAVNALTSEPPTTQAFSGSIPANLGSAACPNDTWVCSDTTFTPAGGIEPTNTVSGDNGWTTFQTCNGVNDMFGTDCYGGTPGDDSTMSNFNIVDGTNITFIFKNNITWTDGIPFNAADYNFSLFQWNIAWNPTTPDLYTADFCAMCGPAGIMADHIANITAGPYSGDSEISIIINSSAVWNTGAVSVAALPWHIWKYFNTDSVSIYGFAMDTTLGYAGAVASCGYYAPPYGTYGTTGSCASSLTPPTWILNLPNMEVGTGPFWLGSITGMGTMSGEAGEMYANLNYYRTAWGVNASDYVFLTGVTSIPMGPECPYPYPEETGLSAKQMCEDDGITLAAISEMSPTGYTTAGTSVISASVSQVCLKGCGAMTYKLKAKVPYDIIANSNSIMECPATASIAKGAICWSTVPDTPAHYANPSPELNVTTATSPGIGTPNIPYGSLYLWNCVVVKPATECTWNSATGTSDLTANGWKAGSYEVVIDATYTSTSSPVLYWQQFTGFTIAAKCPTLTPNPLAPGYTSGETPGTFPSPFKEFGSGPTEGTFCYVPPGYTDPGLGVH